MSEEKRKILILVEGERIDVALMKHLLIIYNIDAKYEIVSYKTNIYTLYSRMFSENDPSAFDLLQVLKEREQNQELKSIFNESYSDVLLIFDFEPQAPDFSPQKIQSMMEYFIESSEMGKLYLNYPMVEAFYHLSSIPDPQFDSRFATLKEIKQHEYKARVNRENRNHNYQKFAVTKQECSIVIKQHIGKAFALSGQEPYSDSLPVQSVILAKQLELLSDEQKTAVLSTCCFFIPEYNPKLIC
jgi:hypothetical protein